MVRYYTYDTNYRYTGFVDSDITVSSATLVAPASTDHQIWNVDTQVWDLPTGSGLTLDELKGISIKLIQDYYDDLVDQIHGTEARFEVESYRTQELEWRAYLADNSASTPYCDQLAASRGITKSELMTKIGNKIISFATLQGQLHNYEDAVKACTTTAELEALSMPWDV